MTAARSSARGATRPAVCQTAKKSPSPPESAPERPIVPAPSVATTSWRGSIAEFGFRLSSRSLEKPVIEILFHRGRDIRVDVFQVTHHRRDRDGGCAIHLWGGVKGVDGICGPRP